MKKGKRSTPLDIMGQAQFGGKECLRITIVGSKLDNQILFNSRLNHQTYVNIGPSFECETVLVP